MTLGGLAVALAYCLCIGGPVGLLTGLLAGALSGLFLFLPFLLRAAGGGDVKMLAATGVVVGLPNVAVHLFLVSVAGFILAMVLWCAGMVDGGRLKHYFRLCFDWRYDWREGAKMLPARSSEKVRVPFGVAIAAGTWMTLLWECIKLGGI